MQCGLVITQDAPAETDIWHYYETEDYISHSDKSKSLMDRLYFLVRRKMAERKRSWIERFTNGKRLIDIGAGTGYFLTRMQEHGWSVIGMEPSEAAREIALRSHGIRLVDPGKLFVIAPASADVITMWHVLEHVHTPEKYLDRIHEVLIPDGVLFIALPNYRSLDARFYGSQWGAWDVPRHLWHFSPEAITSLVQRKGFTLIRTLTLPFDEFYVALISEKYRGGGLMRMMRALVIGSVSRLNAIFRRKNSSSVVYVCRKKSYVHG
jgi:SAM-dependent methyltransferase